MDIREEKFSRANWLVLLLFGTIGQIAWSVENMYFNLFIFDTISPDLEAITLMVQLSGITATVVTLFAGALSDIIGNRRKFISIGYTIWGVTVALFGFLSPELIERIFSLDAQRAISVTLVIVIVADCVMTLFGSTANDAAFNAWVTDNTRPSYRGKVEGVLSILPLLAMLIAAGGFGILVELIDYPALFFGLGAVITASGVLGMFIIKDSCELERNGGIRDIFYGFKPSVIKGNAPLYLTLCIVGIYGIACQIFMPYLIIYMKTYLGFETLDYSLVFGAAIILGAVINLFLGGLTDKMDKAKLLYAAAGVFIVGLAGMFFSHFNSKLLTMAIFGFFGFVMITGYILVAALSGALVRDYTPEHDAGKLQGVRMIFSVLIPMVIGPMIGNAINKAAGVVLENAGADAMTTEYIPVPGIYLAAAIAAVLMFAVIPVLVKCKQNMKKTVEENEIENEV